MNNSRVFNGPVEVGLRALVLLVEAHPAGLDLQRLVTLDYFLIHSGDVDGGPESLHPPSPLRAGELAVRRGLIEDGLRLFRARGLVVQKLSSSGFSYEADDCAASFLDALVANHATKLRRRAQWVFESLGALEQPKLDRVLDDSLGRWRAEFAVLAEDEESE